MQEFHVDIETPGGTMECFAAHPDGDGPFPAVILYMDAPGIREELRDFTRRIAGEGYFCLLPDMYYRLGKIRFNRKADPDILFPVMFKTMDHLSNALVMDDTKGMLEYLDGHEKVRGPYGCIGYCMSGQYVVSAAGTFPSHFKAIASLYGVGIVTEE
ncbi:MAG: dienelactone hydrolase family protein, partial [Alphaproteobacteria bacterium]|nr:dienelactone hydrolase family protein [Alphaproteobacteria bacterium]